MQAVVRVAGLQGSGGLLVWELLRFCEIGEKRHTFVCLFFYVKRIPVKAVRLPGFAAFLFLLLISLACVVQIDRANNEDANNNPGVIRFVHLADLF